MPLEILAVLVIVGVGGVVLAIHLTGGTIDATMKSSEAAAKRFAEDFPDLPTRDVILTSDRKTAFLSAGGSQVGMVHVIGDRFLTRLLTAESPISVHVAAGAKLSIRLGDISWRGGEFEFAAPVDRDAVLLMLTELRNGGVGDG